MDLGCNRLWRSCLFFCVAFALSLRFLGRILSSVAGVALETGVGAGLGLDRDLDWKVDLGRSSVGGLGALSWGADLGMRPGLGLGVDLDLGLTLDMGADLGLGAPVSSAAGAAGEGGDGGGGASPAARQAGGSKGAHCAIRCWYRQS